MICHLCPEGNGKGTLVWDGVRMDDVRRGEDFLRCFSEASWKTVEMDCKEHDDFTAKSQFAAMLTGRVLSAQSLKPSPVNTSPVMSLFDVAETGGKISFDEFFKVRLPRARSESEATSRRGVCTKLLSTTTSPLLTS